MGQGKNVSELLPLLTTEELMVLLLFMMLPIKLHSVTLNNGYKKLIAMLAKMLTNYFLETSAKNSTNVEDAFVTMATEIQKRVSTNGTANDKQGTTVVVNNPNRNAQKNSGCPC